jgi:ligand-binding sensor domain-containing protein
MKYLSILFLSTLFLLCSCSGQNTPPVSDNTIKGIDSNVKIGDTVTSLPKSTWLVFQDQQNHYWFGTSDQGLYRYDGKTILHFSTNHGLLDNSIRGIQEDKSGTIFITTLNGINKFDGQTCYAVPVSETNKWRLDSNDVWFSILGKTGENGPYRYDGKTLHHLKFPKHYMENEYYATNEKHPWSPYEPYTIYKDSKGKIWFGTAEFGICYYDGKSLSWLYEKQLTLIEGGGSFGIRSIIEDKEGKFWFCNTSYRYNILPTHSVEENKILINYTREKGIDNLKSAEGKEMIYFMSVVKDNQGDLWMATYNQGVWRYDGKTTTHYAIKEETKNVTLFSIYKDKQGAIWLGTHEAGPYKFHGNAFGKFKP